MLPNSAVQVGMAGSVISCVLGASVAGFFYYSTEKSLQKSRYTCFAHLEEISGHEVARAPARENARDVRNVFSF
jgi:hypothetical protein